MDAVTQLVLGGVAAQAVGVASRRKHRNRVDIRLSFIGALAGWAPDLDVFITSSTDPFYGIIYHRHFTHSYAFIPIGALFVALLFWFMFKKKDYSFKEMYLVCFVGWATHGTLDACTSYGTQLFWPFSNARIAWDNVSIIDPLYTLPLIAAFIWCLIVKKSKPAIIAMIYGFLYLGFGLYQNHKVLEIQQTMAAERGDKIVEGRAQPSFGNTILWRSVYKTESEIVVDAVRINPFSGTQIWEGKRLPQDKVLSDTKLPQGSLLRRDIEVFDWFSDGYLSMQPSQNPGCLIAFDTRYAAVPNSGEPFWGIEYCLERPNEHAKHANFMRFTSENWNNYLSQLRGTYPGARNL